jgi:hypothetical protein
MANLLGNNIGTNYKGILNLSSTINTPLGSSLRVITDGEGTSSQLFLSTTQVNIGGGSNLGRLVVRGDGTNPIAKFENSSGTSRFTLTDGGLAEFAPSGGGGSGVNAGTFRATYYNSFGDGFTIFETSNANGNAFFHQNVAIGSSVTPVASAVLELKGTTKGFLPPRMTTTQKNNISSPATGLVVFDTDLAKLCVFATTWQTITSV